MAPIVTPEFFEDEVAKALFNERYPEWENGHNEKVEQLRIIAKSLRVDRFRFNMSKLVGYIISFVGGALCAASAFLIPLTFGLATPLSITGGSMLTAGIAIALGTSITETVRLKAQKDRSQKIANDVMNCFQEMNPWLRHTDDLKEALDEISKIDLVKVWESLKKLVTSAMDIREHYARFRYLKATVSSITQCIPGVSASTIAAIIFIPVTPYALLRKIENRLFFDWTASIFKGLTTIVQLADDAFDVIQLSWLLNINAVWGKAILHSIVAAVGITVDVAGIASTSIDAYHGSSSPEAEKIENAPTNDVPYPIPLNTLQ